MNEPQGQTWARAVLIVGATYLVIGRVFALPVFHGRAWRLAAWLISAVVYAAHIAYEHLKLRSAPVPAAFRAALAVALGAITLAIAASIHSLYTTGTVRPMWLVALVAWPALTAVPAFLVALAAGAALGRLRRSEETASSP